MTRYQKFQTVLNTATRILAERNRRTMRNHTAAYSLASKQAEVIALRCVTR